MYTALERASILGDAKLAELAISKGAKAGGPSREDVDGTPLSPLHLAARHNHPDVIRVLVKNGAPINGVGHFLGTPLSEAAFGSAQAVKVLLELGADMTITDSWGSPPAHSTAYFGDIACMRLFIAAGLDFSLRNRGSLNETILYAAVEHSTEMVKYLLGQGAGRIINLQDCEGRTALHEVVSWGKGADLVRLLLYHGADMEVKDDMGCTALDLAVERDDDSMAEALLEFKANVLDRV